MPTFQEITQALVNCMTVEPPVDYALSRDASHLATVYAEMMYLGQLEGAVERLSAKQVDAFVRWSAQPPAKTDAEH